MNVLVPVDDHFLWITFLSQKKNQVHSSNAHNETFNIVEVDKFKAGNEITTFNVNGFKCGLAICYDAFFDEFVKIYGREGGELFINWIDHLFEYFLFSFEGCDLMIFAAAFHVTFGDSWELIHRARALDNQMYVAAVSPARDEQASYVVYGHSMIIDPLGQVLTKAGISEGIVFHEIG